MVGRWRRGPGSPKRVGGPRWGCREEGGMEKNWVVRGWQGVGEWSKMPFVSLSVSYSGLGTGVPGWELPPRGSWGDLR